ncbi:CoA transferase [Actinoallomurus purpureus]|uniref:CaiB/BaiF CoA transferase family protein n=1 Tax=Actinoallomurus purpureus TaxID=478114 RepID=UPI002093446C|nr:CoA transferase [Actinoallomurus purpureus]MCO6011207.1 CoA transferase [Actinoallomurus purpureus]
MGLLGGLRVLDLTMWRPGPYATQLLAQLGADVLKVEPPGGEPMRAFRGHFDLLNRHKRSIVIDLKADAARCRELAADANVFVEGYRPGVADRLGVGYDAVRAVNPRIVYCSISGYGASGPLASLPGHDVNYRAYTGTVPPDDGGHEFPVADMAAATMAAFAILAACHKGGGERIDLGMADVLANWAGTVPVTSAPPPGGSGPGRGRGPVPGYGVYPAHDGGKVSLGVVSEDRLWSATCRALGLDHHAGLSFPERLSRAEELDRDISEKIAALPRDTVVARLTDAGAPVAPVLSPAEVRTVDHFQQRGVIDGSPVRTLLDPPLPPGRAPDLDGADGWTHTPTE